MAVIVGSLIVGALNIDHRLDVGRWFRGSDTTRMRVAVVTIGDLALMILAFRFWSAGLPLALLTAVAYTHGIADGNIGCERGRSNAARRHHGDRTSPASSQKARFRRH